MQRNILSLIFNRSIRVLVGVSETFSTLIAGIPSLHFPVENFIFHCADAPNTTGHFSLARAFSPICSIAFIRAIPESNASSFERKDTLCEDLTQITTNFV